MSIKLKALGLAVFAALAVGAFGVVSAVAETGGHFTSDAPSEGTTIEGADEELHFAVKGFNPDARIGCDVAEYHGTALSNTVTELTIEPEWNECYTTGDKNNKFEIHENGCHLKFTVNAEPEVKHSTVHVDCPTGKEIEITHPNCAIGVPDQTVDGVTYTTKEVGGKHAITVDVTVGVIENEVQTPTITTHFESFGCILVFGTKQEAEMIGDVTVEGFDHESLERVNITAT